MNIYLIIISHATKALSG